MARMKAMGEADGGSAGDLGLRLPRNGKFQDINVLILGCRGVGVQIPGLSSKQQTRTVIANCRFAEVSLELCGLESQVETAKNLILSNVSNSAIVKKWGDLAWLSHSSALR